MRVLTIGPLPPPPGGMATVVANLHAVVSQRLEHRVFNNAKTTREDRRIHEAVLAQLGLILRYLLMLVRFRPHIVHIHTCSGFTFWRNGLDLVLAKLLFRRVILHVHGGRFGQFLQGLSPTQQAAVRWLFRRCAVVIVLGPVWESLLAGWVGGTPLITVPNGVRVPGTSVTQGDQLQVVCVAGIEPGKGQMELLDGLIPLRDRPWNLVFVGPVVDARYQGELEARVAEAGIGERVRFTGPLSSELKDEVLGTSQLFVLASHDEALPMSMLEAMANSIPVVMTDVGSVSDVILDQENGYLVPARDVSALSEAMLPLLDDSALRQRIGTRGKNTVVDRYSMESVVDSLLDVYEIAIRR